MYGIGKSTAWTVFKEFHYLIDGINIGCPNDCDYECTQKFMFWLFKDNVALTLEDIRATLILSTNWPEEISPTSDAAKLHISRAFLQAYQWVDAYIPVQDILSNDLLKEGFTLDSEKNILKPIMMTKDPMSKAVVEMISCNCRTGCDSCRCNCFKANLKCTVLCHKRSRDSCVNLISV